MILMLPKIPSLGALGCDPAPKARNQSGGSGPRALECLPAYFPACPYSVVHEAGGVDGFRGLVVHHHPQYVLVRVQELVRELGRVHVLDRVRKLHPFQRQAKRPLLQIHTTTLRMRHAAPRQAFPARRTMAFYIHRIHASCVSALYLPTVFPF